MTLNKLLEKINKNNAVIRRESWFSGVAVIKGGRVYQGYHYQDKNLVYVSQSERYRSREDFAFTVADLLADNWQSVDGCTITDKPLFGFAD